MTKEDILSKFKELKDSTGQILLDSDYVINLYLSNNYHNHKSFIIVSKHPHIELNSSKSIQTNQFMRIDSQYITVFELLNENLFDEFVDLFYDIYLNTKDENNELDALFKFMDRFTKWQYLLDIQKGFLNESEIKGLLGELLFINELSQHRRINEIIQAWNTREDASTDFLFDDIWYEIKTISISKSYVNISSIDQLDQKTTGHLYVYEIQKSNEKSNHLSLPKIVQKILEKLVDIKYIDLFLNKLLLKGYVDSQHYSHYIYYVENRRVYRVDQDFPKIKRINLNDAIKSVRYDLYFDGIEKWRIE